MRIVSTPFQGSKNHHPTEEKRAGHPTEQLRRKSSQSSTPGQSDQQPQVCRQLRRSLLLSGDDLLGTRGLARAGASGGSEVAVRVANALLQQEHIPRTASQEDALAAWEFAHSAPLKSGKRV